MPEWTPFQSPPEKPATSIKRSSWNAGMAAEFAQMAPPGSPAAWHSRRRSMNPTVGSVPRFEVPDDAPATPSAPSMPSMPSMPTGPSLDPPASLMRSGSPLRSHSPVRKHLQVPSLDPIRSVSGSALGPDDGTNTTNPFNFTSTYVTPNSGSARRGRAPGASQRRGHHYKHSSVSLNFFQEPEERAPLALPVSLAVPNMSEYWQSITPPQSRALAWCTLKLIVTLGCYAVGSPVHSMALLAHLLAYETVVSTTVALVAILANFEVWSRSSLRLPFALKRVEVLVAFGLSVVLLFISSDVVSHIVQELATGHSHGHDHGHEHEEDPGHTGKSLRGHFALVLMALLTTLPTAWRGGNVLARSTALFAFVVLVIPLLSPTIAPVVDALVQPAIVATMAYLGYTSSKLFGGMLAMSYGGPDRSSSVRDLITSDPNVVQVEAISLWQVHHDLWLATMRIVMSGTVEDERRVRTAAERAVREAVDVRDVEWETTVEIHRAEDTFF